MTPSPGEDSWVDGAMLMMGWSRGLTINGSGWRIRRGAWNGGLDFPTNPILPTFGAVDRKLESANPIRRLLDLWNGCMARYGALPLASMRPPTTAGPSTVTGDGSRIPE